MERKTSVLSALALFLLGTLSISPPGQAQKGSLAISGEITAPTCKVLGVIADSEIGTGRAEPNATFVLANLSEYSDSSDSYLWFQIQLSNCFASTQHNLVSLRMSSPWADKEGQLRNALPNGAQGKVVRLYDRSTGGAGFMAVGSGRSGPAPRALHTPAQDGNLSFSFIAMATQAHNEDVTPGPFTTLVNYELQYQ